MGMRRFLSRPAPWLTVLAAALVAVDLGRRILATNDEARFALLAQDMLSRGAWFLPQLNGATYHAKPLLQAWLIALFSWPVGHVTQLTAVLPSALAGVGTMLVVYALGRQMFGAVAGGFAAMVTITTQGWFLHARLPMPDMLLTFCLTLTFAVFWRMVRDGGRAWMAFYPLVALSFWSKGVAGLIPLVAVIAHAVITRRQRDWRQLHLPVGIAVVALLVAPWWFRQWTADSAMLREVVVSDNLQWYLPRSMTATLLTGALHHVVGILFPWVIVVPAVMWQAARLLRQRGAERDAVYVLTLWAVVVLTCVGLSEQQRLRYYAPLVPPVALLVGWWCAAVTEERRSFAQIPWRIYGVAAGVVALATAAAVAFRPTWADSARIYLPNSASELAEVSVMTVGLVLMIGALSWGMWRDGMRRAFAVAWVGSALWVAGWYHWELEARNAAYDYPRVQAAAAQLLPEAPLVAAWGVYELPFSFYSARRVVSVSTDDDLWRVMTQHPRSSAVLTEAALAQVDDRDRLRVVPLDRLNFNSIVLVTYAPGAPRPGAQP